MLTLLSALSLPYLRAHAARIAITLLGIVIGVQGMVAMGALHASITRSFETGIEAVAGDAVLQVAGPDTGVPDALIAELRTAPGVARASGMIQGTLRTADGPGEPISVFGVDFVDASGQRNPQFPREHLHIEDDLVFLNSPDSIALARPLLERLRVGVGDGVALVTPEGVTRFTVRGTLDAVGFVKALGGSVAVLDLSSAQRLFLAPGLVQSIYVTAQPGWDTDELAASLRALVGERARVERTTVRGQQVSAILASLRVALSLASAVTMIVGFFIIYQTTAISVEQRRREIAIARAVGFRRRSLLALFLVESCALGVAGALGGIAGGYLLARISLQTVTAGIADVYLSVVASTVVLPLGYTAAAAGFGIGTCILAGVIPALRAAREPPAAVLRSTSGAAPERLSPSTLALAIGGIAVAILLLSRDLRLDSSAAKSAWILLGHTSLFAGFALLAPALSAAIGNALRPLGARLSLPYELAAQFFVRSPGRHGSPASAIMVGYALVIVLGAVVHSMERTLDGWLSHRFGSDLAIHKPPSLANASFDSTLAEQLIGIPGIADLERGSYSLFSYRGQPVVLMTFDHKHRPDHEPVVLLSAQAKAYEEAAAGRAVFISESLAFRLGYRVGDVLRLDTALGARDFRIAAIARDYTFDLGTILVDIDVYQSLWEDTRLTYANLWTDQTVPLAELRRQVAERLIPYPQISLFTNAEFKADVSTRLNNLLRVLSSLQVLACLIAVLGVMNCLLAETLDRAREIALLRSVGVTSRQVVSAVVVEAGLIGTVGVLLGVIEGSTAAFYMVAHSIKVAMSWSLDFAFPSTLAASTAVVVVLAAALAGYLPGLRAARRPLVGGLRAE